MTILFSFILFYLLFLALVMLLNYFLLFFQPQWHLEVDKSFQIANVAFAVAFLLFISTTIFIIPMQHDANIKRYILGAVFVVSYLLIVYLAYSSQYKEKIKQLKVEK